MKLPRVTDHCIVRYLERSRGLDIESIRRHIQELCAAPAAAGALCVHAEGVKFEIDHGSVVTCTPRNGGVNKTKRGKILERARERQRARQEIVL